MGGHRILLSFLPQARGSGPPRTPEPPPPEEERLTGEEEEDERNGIKQAAAPAEKETERHAYFNSPSDRGADLELRSRRHSCPPADATRGQVSEDRGLLVRAALPVRGRGLPAPSPRNSGPLDVLQGFPDPKIPKSSKKPWAGAHPRPSGPTLGARDADRRCPEREERHRFQGNKCLPPSLAPKKSNYFYSTVIFAFQKVK